MKKLKGYIFVLNISNYQLHILFSRTYSEKNKVKHFIYRTNWQLASKMIFQITDEQVPDLRLSLDRSDV